MAKMTGGLSALAPFYDIVLCDVFGVIHHGAAPHAAAIDALVSFRRDGGRVALVSNSAATGLRLTHQLKAMAVPADAFDLVVTSGDVTRALIGGRSILHVGSQSERILFEGLALPFTDEQTADVIVCTGFADPLRNTISDLAPILSAAASRGIELLCSNPDLTARSQAGTRYFAGMIAQEYERLGGFVRHTGKPDRRIYEAAFAALGCALDNDRARALAVGDTPALDVAGAHGAGIDCLWIADAEKDWLGLGMRDPVISSRLFRMPALVW